MGARTWLLGMLTIVACEGSIETLDATERDGVDPGPNTIADTGTGTGTDTDTSIDTGTNTSAGADTGTGAGGAAGTGGFGGDPGPCADGPLAAPIPDCRPEPAPSTGDLHADCVARINRFRWECQCLPPLERWMDGEECADSNAQYDSVNGVHASFYDIPCGSGARAQNECPGWPSTNHVITGCLQSMWDEGPEDGDPSTVNGHYEAMATAVYTRVACGFSTTPGGQVWGVQNFD